MLLSLSSAVVAMLVVPMTTCSRRSGKAWVGAPAEHGDLGATAARSGREGMRFRHITRLSGSHSYTCTRHALCRRARASAQLCSTRRARLRSGDATAGTCTSSAVCNDREGAVQRRHAP